MAGTNWFVIALVAVASVVSTTTEAATSHVVGGSAGWTIPTSGSTYSQWLSSQKFAVGDSLVFNFKTGTHSVIEVPKSSFDSCSANNQIGPSITTGPATVTLTSPGKHYYICGVPGHCAGGQKLAIDVTTGSSASTPASAPAAGGPATTPAATPSTSAAAPKSSNAAGSPAATPSTSVAPRSSNAAGGPATTPKTPSTSSSGPTGSDAGGNRFPTAASGPAGDGPSSSAPASVASCGYLMVAFLTGAGALLM